MKKSKGVEIVLENCEVYTFAAKDVNLLFDEVNVHYWGEDKFLCPKHTYISISKDAKVTGIEDWQEDWQERLNHNDITQVHINGEAYHVDWDMKSEWKNAYQTSVEGESQWEYVISRTRKTLDEF